MLRTIGVTSVDDLTASIPSRLEGLLNIPEGMSEPELLRLAEGLAQKNRPVGKGKCFLGAGAYEHAIPSIIEALVSRGEFSTAYTPYQAEASQGTLISTFEFQTMVAEIMGMDVANASMYDGPSAMAEAALLALRHTKRSKVVLSGLIHPEWREVTRTYLSGIRTQVTECRFNAGTTSFESVNNVLDSDSACLIVQQPNFIGQLEDLHALGRLAREAGALFIVACNPLSLGVIAPPGEVGADVAVGEAQPLGIAVNYGGPYAGLFAVRNDLVRQMPGRLVGMTYDSNGLRGFTLTLQTREQHIRRERATSNICTNQALMALSTSIYLSLVGKNGFEEIARKNLILAHWAADLLTKIDGVSLAYEGPFFNEFVIKLPQRASEVLRKLAAMGFWGGYDLGLVDSSWDHCLMVCVTETKTRSDIEEFASGLKEAIK